MTTNDLDLAREWAQLVGPGAASNIGRAAAEVIASLPDEWIDADKLRETIEFHRDRLPYGAEEDLRALLPDPTPRTLADMDDDEREACRWMQVEVRWVPGERGVITHLTDFHAKVMWHDGTTTLRDHKDLTPLPDLPRMVWPGEQATEEDMSIIPPKIDTSTGHVDDVDMTPEDAPEGEPWTVECYGDRYVGTRYSRTSPNNWALARMDGMDVTLAGDHEVTLVSRLVPEVTA